MTITPEQLLSALPLVLVALYVLLFVRMARRGMTQPDLATLRTLNQGRRGLLDEDGQPLTPASPAEEIAVRVRAKTSEGSCPE